MEHLLTTRMIKGKHSRGRLTEKMTEGITHQLQSAIMTEMLMTTKEKEVERDGQCHKTWYHIMMMMIHITIKKNAKGFLGVMLFKLKTKILYVEEVKEVLIA